jgi:hypothetical protein
MEKRRITGVCAAVLAGLFLSAAVAAPAVAAEDGPPPVDGYNEPTDGYSGNTQGEPTSPQP